MPMCQALDYVCYMHEYMYFYSHLTDKETEFQRVLMICPSLLS